MPWTNNKGYWMVSLGRGHKRLVHRLVACAFLPTTKDGVEVDHKNGKKHDNRACNLQWITHRENTVKSHAGAKCNRAKLTERQVREVRWLLDERVKMQAIASFFGVSYRTICSIKSGRTWSSVQGKKRPAQKAIQRIK